MLEINLQLFSGGGARSGLGGGGGDRDAKNSDADTYRFTFKDENGKEHTIDIRADNFEEAKELLRNKLRRVGIKQTKDTKVEKLKNKQGRVAKNVTDVVSSVSDSNNNTKINLSGSPLSYTGEKTVLDKDQIKTIKKIANEIKNKTKENLTAFDSNGKIIYNKEGTGLEVSTPSNIARQERYDIHNHTRGDGVLGGTFSVVDSDGNGDMVGFTKYDNKQAAFASAKEGVYYISKREGFKSKEFLNHMRNFESKAEKQMGSALNDLKSQYDRGNMTYKTYKARYNRIKNKYLVDMHNEYLKNQGRYGYDYGLLKH